ncbi:AbrB/MazE/SpoVT family DNA-binding domain-containing protein [bacterium]|nr:MAG: AbrB/MazE/SpoVT family DNA-binding domain-containing protein [bacterium]
MYYGDDPMAIVKANVKGQIFIPAQIRKKLSIGRGSQLKISEEGNRIVIEPLQPDAVEAGRGMLKSGGRVLKLLLEDRKYQEMTTK